MFKDTDPKDIKCRKELSALVTSLLDSPEELRPDLVAQLVELCGSERVQHLQSDEYKEFWALVMDGMIERLAAIRSADQSLLFRALQLIPRLPLDVRNYKHTLLQRLWMHINRLNEANFELFDKVQLIYLMVRLGDFGSALRVSNQIEHQIDSSEPLGYLIYNACKAHILAHHNQGSDFACLWLNLIPHFYHTDSADTALFVIILWIKAMKWPSDSLTKQRLLSKINSLVNKNMNVNTAFVLYDIFSLQDRLMPPDKKMMIAELLINRLAPYLSVRQLQELHFFCGNYSSAMRTDFNESIQYFKFSNYYQNRVLLHQIKCSQFIRSILSAEEFVEVMPFFETRIMMLGNQIGIYNNTYVESLQADYDKIEMLLTQVEELSLTDTLTGLKNRRHLEENLIQIMRLATRHGTPISFAMVDIDHFKKVNDKWGHPAGDRVLVGLAEILNEEFRKSDVVIRYGGEEFLIILFDSKLEDTLVKMEMLRAKVEAHVFRYKDIEIKVTISIGVNKQDRGIYDEMDVARCIEAADDALYRAKNEGRNQVRIA